MISRDGCCFARWRGSRSVGSPGGAVGSVGGVAATCALGVVGGCSLLPASLGESAIAGGSGDEVGGGGEGDGGGVEREPAHATQATSAIETRRSCILAL